MQELFEESGGLLLTGTFLCIMIVAALGEALFPRRQESKGLIHRWLSHSGLMVVNHFILRLSAPVIAFTTAYYSSAGQIGLLNHVEVEFWTAAFISLVVLDLSVYALHFAKHKVSWLWRLHMVHHSDKELDFTTTFREYPLEVVISVFAAVPVIVLLGLPPVAVLFYQVVAVVINILQHSNIYLPEWLDKILRRVFATPDFHRIHHSSEQAFTDSNYGGILTWFDFLFGTARTRAFNEQQTMELGLEYFRDQRDSRLDQLLLMPFRAAPVRGVSKDEMEVVSP